MTSVSLRVRRHVAERAARDELVEVVDLAVEDDGDSCRLR